MGVRYLLSSGLLVVMLLAACGTETDVTDIPDSTSTPATTAVESTTATTERQSGTETTTQYQEPQLRTYSSALSLPAFATPEGDYWISSIVIQDRDEPAIVCVGFVNASLPPQCAGLVLVGFDWSGIDHEDRGDLRFSSSTYLEGRIEGDTFVVSFVRNATESDRLPSHPPDLSSPCPEPAGGWTIVSPALVTDEAFGHALGYGNTIDDLSAIWVTQPPVEVANPVDVIVNVAVVDNVELHQEELRARWGGPLCVFQRPGRAADLRAIQDEIVDEPTSLGITSVGVDEIGQVVAVGVIVADAGTVAYFVDRFGAGVVQVTGHFQQLDRG